jgi:hypothetical protein
MKYTFVLYDYIIYGGIFSIKDIDYNISVLSLKELIIDFLLKNQKITLNDNITPDNLVISVSGKKLENNEILDNYNFTCEEIVARMFYINLSKK